MFKKKPNIKPLAPIRSSDRRKIADQIIADFHIDTSGNDKEQQNQGDQNTAGSLSSIRTSILPDNSQSGRFTTMVGPDQIQVDGTVYVGSHPGEEQRILWVKVEDRLYPTVYTLWHNPGLVPLLHTPSMVVEKLRGGADLMVPGLARGPPFPTAAIKGSIVAVAGLDRPSVPLFVGVCEVDINKLSNVQGQKGKAVRGFHWVGDELWEWSTMGKQGPAVPEHIDGWDFRASEDDHDLDDGVEQLNIAFEDHEDEGGVRLNDVEQSAPVEEENVLHEDNQDHEKTNKDQEPSYTTKDIDEVFRQAFLYGVHHFKTKFPDDPKHGLDYPLTSSFVMSDLVLPYLPIFTPGQAAAFQLKKTSWKNIKKFIKQLDKEVLVKSKDRNGGETVILDVDFEDRAVSRFTPYKLPKKDQTSPSGESQTKNLSAEQSRDDSIGQNLRRVVLYKPKDKQAPIFAAANASVKSTYSASEIRPIVTAYIEKESLVSPKNKRFVKLDPVLANVVFDSPSTKDREILAKGEVARDALMDRVIEGCSPLWAVLQGEQTAQDVKPRVGSAPDVQIVLETRSGNKTVTKLSGLETYHINPQPLADELQKSCASSTSVSQVVGSSPKNPLMEVMVQGPQSQAVIKALEKRGINRQWISINDKTKGKKR
ncbi:MAG: hypothetical protein M1816_001262 [Peltula sp. TS41687]|nr:MAG: hypothetical protein M1816_001262 [Peltula sp. TS41687]